jgi:non-ribosomal peptide synthetase component F
MQTLQVIPEPEMSRAGSARGRTVHARFEGQASASPDAAAVLFENRRLSNACLNERANRLAHPLLRLGVERGKRSAPQSQHGSDRQRPCVTQQTA